MTFILLNIILLSVGSLMLFYAVNRYTSRYDYSFVLTACIMFPIIARGTAESTEIIFTVFIITALLHILEPAIMRILKNIKK